MTSHTPPSSTTPLIALLLLGTASCDGCGGASGGGDCADIAGEWTQSYVCYNEVINLCERNDESTFTISDTCGSDVLTTFVVTERGVDTVQWEASDDVDPEGVSEGDYDESGTWTFSVNRDSFTSTSEFIFTAGPNQGRGGPCVANATKDGPPTPVACGAICDGAANAQDICP